MKIVLILVVLPRQLHHVYRLYDTLLEVVQYDI